MDPVPDLVNGKSINTDTFTALATLGRPVSGIAADGIARLVVRVAAAAAGQALTLSLIDDGGSVSSNPVADGQLADIYGNLYGGQMQLAAVSTSQGPMAFAVYIPPSDFSRGTASDDNAVTRGVSLSVNPVSNPSATSTMGVTIWRPPVVLVHGLWSSSQAWDAFTGVSSDPHFFIRMSDYSQPVAITSTVPSYSAKALSGAIASGLGFAYNVTKVTTDIDKAVSEFRLVNNAAAAQADIVAHSMGGDITRTLIQSARYPSSDSFGAGTVHKLITIGTPHLGSPVALAMLSPGNSCVAGLLASNGTNIPIGEATLATGASVTGAIGDLQGSGIVSGFLSPALQQIQTNTGVQVPTALIAGVTNAGNLSGLNTSLSALAISGYCGAIWQNPPALDLNASQWNSVFGQDNDGMVPLSSELNGMSGSPFTGVVHSAGTEALGFLGPSELDYQPIQTQVIAFLNASVGSSNFVLLP